MAKDNDQSSNSSNSSTSTQSPSSQRSNSSSNAQLNRNNGQNRRNNNREHPTIPAEEGNPNCPVCLNRVQERSYTNTCLHEFCFPCIQEWSRNHNRCPVCRERYTNILHNIKSSTEYDELPVEEPTNEMNGLLITDGRIGILMTPLDSGIYLINRRTTPHGRHFDLLFLGPNQRYILNNMSPDMIIVRPEQLDNVLTQLDQLGIHRYHPHHGRHPNFSHHRHNHQNQQNGQNNQRQNPDSNNDNI